MAAFLDEVKLAMRTSSLKGIPRIITARSLLHRAIWTVAVFCFFCICMFTVSLNIQSYLGYPKVVNVEEKRIDLADPNGTVPFPAIGVCNLNPIGSNKSVFEENGIPTPYEFHQKVLEVTQCEGCSAEKLKLATTVRQTLMSSRGYYQYVGMEDMAKIGAQPFVLSCQVYFMIGSAGAVLPCDEVVNVIPVMHPDVGVCLLYESQAPKGSVVSGYFFNFHVDSSRDNMLNTYDSSFLPPRTSGAVIYVLDPYTVPNLLRSYATVPPGMSTNVYVKSTRIDRLSKPYSEQECAGPNEFTSLPYAGRYFKYDDMTCYGNCTVDYVINKCNCTDLWLMQSPEPVPPKVDYCASLHRPKEELFEKVLCTEKTKGLAFEHCRERCKEPCTQIKYDLRTTTSKWPIPSQYGSFYETTIKENPAIYNRYKHLEETAKHAMKDAPSVPEAEWMKLSNAIEHNFASGTVLFLDRYYTHHYSKPKFTADALISQLGGSLNLWSGITVMIIVELIDFTINIVNRLRYDKEKITKKQDSIPLQLPVNTSCNHEDNSTSSKESVNFE